MSNYRPAIAAACLISAGFAATTAAKAPVGRFTVKTDATGEVVMDALLKLTWQRAEAPSPYIWSGAKSYCSELALQGGGWRLPDLRELQGLVDFKEPAPSIDKAAFPTPKNGYFWSSTAYQPSPSSDAWGVYFGHGSNMNIPITTKFFVRCVR